MYVPWLQTGGGVAAFLRTVRGHAVPSTVPLAPLTRAFVSAVEDFAAREGVDLVRFAPGQRKDDETRRRL